MGYQTSHSNRLVDREGVDKLLKLFREGNLDRTKRKHHMLGTTNRQNAIAIFTALTAAGTLKPPPEGCSDLLAWFRPQLLALNADVQFPWYTDDILMKAEEADDDFVVDKIILQAGQHRLAAIQEYHAANEDEAWWPIRIHIDDDLDLACFETLRTNVTTIQFNLSDGERACQIWDYKMTIADLYTEKKRAQDRADNQRVKILQKQITDHEFALEVKMNEFGVGSKAKANGLLKPKEAFTNLSLTKAIVHACRHPGLARDFSFSALGEIQALRIQEVSLQHPPTLDSAERRVYERILSTS